MATPNHMQCPPDKNVKLSKSSKTSLLNTWIKEMTFVPSLAKFLNVVTILKKNYIIYNSHSRRIIIHSQYKYQKSNYEKFSMQ
jgi:hypothetical protein